MSFGVTNSSSLSVQTLVPRNVADRMERGSADLAGSLGDVVRHGENLLSVFVHQQVVIAEVPPTHMPVEILRLDIDCEHVGKQLS